MTLIVQLCSNTVCLHAVYCPFDISQASVIDMRDYFSYLIYWKNVIHRQALIKQYQFGVSERFNFFQLCYGQLLVQ